MSDVASQDPMATPALKRITQIINFYNQAHSDAAHDQASRIYSEYIGPLTTRAEKAESEVKRLGRENERLRNDLKAAQDMLVTQRMAL